MSGFGGFGGGGGFGSTNNTQNTGFGGFGANNQQQQQQQQNQTPAFGASAGSGFGASTNTGGGLFGSNNNTNTTSGFGASGGFGGASLFGQNKTGFGATTTTPATGGGLFGNNNAATTGGGFGGFGGTANTGGFGSTNNTAASGGLFGQAKPAFGATGSTGMFGNNNTATATTGFGAAANTGTSSFGAGSGSAFGSTPQNNGTGSTPFAAHVDKDPGSANATNHYQSITAMPVFQAFSPEELRVVDYQQGRKFGTSTGQVGGFGASGFGGGFGSTATPAATGGFGSSTTTGGLFGSTANTNAGGFGSTAATTAPTGFGSSATGGLFGSKPAGGGLFGNTAAQAPAAGGLFGSTANNTTGGFGSSTTGGLFGQQAAKPAGFSFGNTVNTGTGFGASTTPAAGGGLFGSTPAATTGFGATNNASTGGFSFGQQNQAVQQPAQTGGLFGGGGFGANNNAPKPGGLFGSTPAPATGGLFGSQPAQPATGGLFGNANNQQQTGGLFGGAAKPATGGLFGGSATGATGGGLFGSQQPAQTGGLFGNSTAQAGGGLFGAKPAQTSGGLFGSTAAQPATGGSLFGGMNSQQQQQPSGLGSSMFNSTFQSPQQVQQPQGLTASLTGNVYGSPQLFSGLETPTQSLGPIATPLSGNTKTRKQAIIPAYKINPAASSRLITPQKRPTGYGFAYSSYGTPGSAIGNNSPTGLNNSLLSGGSLGRSLGKSMSSSNLRHSFTAQNSLLLPDAFSATRSSTGSMKKLNINRNIKVRSLFGEEEEQPTRLRKKVSFDDVNKTNGASNDSGLDGMSGALVRTEEVSSSTNGATNSDTNGKELAIVPEEGSPAPRDAVLTKENNSLRDNQRDQKLGQYWMKPSQADIQKRSDKKIKNFTVGREGAGQIVFSQVDLTNVNINEILGTLVVIEIRRATVYPEKTNKPPAGQGLNVPSIITLENAWPRAQAGKAAVLEKKGRRFEKHLERLKRIPDCEFVDYETTTGRWSFKVPHYTTYGLDYEEDGDTTVLSEMQELPTPTPFKPTPRANGHLDSVKSDRSMPSPPESDVDDTFEFKKLYSSRQKEIPGQYEYGMTYEDEAMDDTNEALDTPQSFLDERSVGSLAEDHLDHQDDVDADGESESVADQEMAGSFPLIRTMEPTNALNRTQDFDIWAQPETMFGLSQINPLGTPMKPDFAATWTEQLLRAVSPRKQDRRALRDNQELLLRDVDEPMVVSPTKAGKSTKKMTTSIDLMNELFGQNTAKKSVKQAATAKGLEFPKAKRAKLDDTEPQVDDQHYEFHNSCKPRWSPSGTLVYTVPGNVAKMDSGIFQNINEPVVGEHKDVRFAKFSPLHDQIPRSIEVQKLNSAFDEESMGMTDRVVTIADLTLSEMAGTIQADRPAVTQERYVWELASILFDPLDDTDLTHYHAETSSATIRRDTLSAFWKKLVRGEAEAAVASAKSPEERAIIWLSCGDVEEACSALLTGKNFHLATMVAQLPGGKGFQDTMSKQIQEWRRLETLSEFDASIRTIYEILAGNVCRSEGKAGPGRENSMKEIIFSAEYNLDWRRAFGLRLWYDDDIDLDEAVIRLAEEMQSGDEPVRATPWFVQQNINMEWDDPALQQREDVLWGLLKLYTAVNQPDNGLLEVSLASVLEPANVTGNPMDVRLSFQLYDMLESRYAPEGEEFTDMKDKLSLTYAESLVQLIDATGDRNALDTAVWALLHLSQPEARETQIRNLLATHAPLLSPMDQPIELLQQLPEASTWEFAAKAQYARAVEHDAVAECKYLVHAGEWAQAHTVLRQTIGPEAIISRHHDQLREVLGLLREDIGIETAAWHQGGEMFFDYLELCDIEPKTRSTTTTSISISSNGATTKSADASRANASRAKELIGKLAKSLASVKKSAGLGIEIRESIAMQLMAEHVALVGGKPGVGLDKKVLLDMPLSSEACGGVAREAAVEYYRRLVQG